jgi:hypothetical protein
MTPRPTRAIVTFAALATIVLATNALAAHVVIKPISASIASVTVDYGCGPTPVPNQPPPKCETLATLKVVYLGVGCSAEDFFIRVRQLPNEQLVSLFQVMGVSNCEMFPSTTFSPGFSHVVLETFLIQHGKPIRLKNRLPLMNEPRP